MLSIVSRGVIAALALVTLVTSAEAAPCDGRKSDEHSLIEPGAPLSLANALGEVRRTSPEVLTAGLEARALGAEADQAARPLNPNIVLELEDFSGSGAAAGFNQAETTFTIQQTFRLGGKRRLGERAARMRQALASADCTVILREAELQTALLFADLVAAQAIRDRAAESAEISNRLLATVERRVDAGAAAPPELARARADAASLRASAEGAETEVNARRYALASLWGEVDPMFGPPVPIGTFEAVESDGSLPDNPRLDAADAAVRAREAETALARSAAIPDVTVSAGFRRFEETGDQAIVAGISVPLPLFDRGTDMVRASMYRASAASINRRTVEQRLLSQLRSAVAARRIAQTQLDILVQDALPAAVESYAAAERGYEIGRFDLTTTLIARSVLLETQVAVIEAERVLLAEDLRLRALVGAAPFEGGRQ